MVNDDGLVDELRGFSMRVGDPDWPAPVGCRPGDRDVATQVHQHSAVGGERGAGGGAVGGQRLSSGTEIDSHIRVDGDGVTISVKVDCRPAGYSLSGWRRRFGVTYVGVVAVVSQPHERPSDGRVDQPVSCLCRVTQRPAPHTTGDLPASRRPGSTDINSESTRKRLHVASTTVQLSDDLQPRIANR